VSVLLRFTVDADAFELGRVLAPPPGLSLELERVVPTGSGAVPFVWATGENHEAFVERVRAHETVESVTVVDRFGDRGLYRLRWREPATGLFGAIRRSEAAILEARGGETWAFALRFASTDAVQTFHAAVREPGLPVQVDQIRPPSGPEGDPLGLSAKQREALTAAVRRGYFASPSEVPLEAIADEFGVTPQALSKRIRRGNEKVLRRVLLPSAEY
jgi:predicted DNA binding protein